MSGSDRRAAAAVVLLSGGLDSATVLAIATADGFELPRAELPLRPAPRRRARRGGGRVAAAARRRRARRHRHRPARVRRLGAHRRHRRAQARRVSTTWTSTASRSPTCRPATRSSCPSRWPGPRCSGAADIFIGVNALDYCGYPDCRPGVHRRLRDHGQPRHQGRRRGRPRLTIHTPLIDLTKAEIIRRGTGARRRLRDDRQLLRRRRRRRGLRPLRLVPACGARASSTPGVDRPAPAYQRRVAALIVTLPGQGDLPHAAGRGRPRRPARGVLPLHRLQPLDRARGAPGQRRLPVLRHRLRRHRRPGRWRLRRRRRRWPTPSPRAWAGDAGRRRRPASWSAPAASRCSSSTTPLVDALHDRGFEIAIETNGTLAGARRDRLGLREPQGRRRPGGARRRRAQAGVPAGRAPTRARSRTSAFDRFFLQPMDGPDRRGQHRGRHRLLPGPPALAAQPADPQVPRDPLTVDRHLQGVHASRPPTGCPTCRDGPQVRPPARPLVPGRRSTSTARSADESGWVMDFADLDRRLRPAARRSSTTATSTRSRPREPDQRGARPVDLGSTRRRCCPASSQVVVRETCTSRVRVSGE